MQRVWQSLGYAEACNVSQLCSSHAMPGYTRNCSCWLVERSPVCGESVLLARQWPNNVCSAALLQPETHIIKGLQGEVWFQIVCYIDAERILTGTRLLCRASSDVLSDRMSASIVRSCHFREDVTCAAALKSGAVFLSGFYTGQAGSNDSSRRF